MSAEPHQEFISALLRRLDQEEIPYESKLHILALLTHTVIKGIFNNKWIIVRHALKMHGIDEKLVHIIEKPEDFSSLSYSAEECKSRYNDLVKKLKLFSPNALSKKNMASLIAREYCSQRAIADKDYFNNVASAYHMFQSNQKRRQIIQNIVISNLGKLCGKIPNNKAIKDLVYNYVMALQHKAQTQQPLLEYTRQLQKLLGQNVSEKAVRKALTDFPVLLNITSADSFRKTLNKEYTNFALKEYKVAYFKHKNAKKDKIKESLFIPVQKMRLMHHSVVAIDYSYPDYQTVISAYSAKEAAKFKLSSDEVFLELNPSNVKEPLLYEVGNAEGMITISHIPISAASQIIRREKTPKHQPVDLIDSAGAMIQIPVEQKRQTK